MSDNIGDFDPPKKQRKSPPEKPSALPDSHANRKRQTDATDDDLEYESESDLLDSGANAKKRKTEPRKAAPGKRICQRKAQSETSNDVGAVDLLHPSPAASSKKQKAVVLEIPSSDDESPCAKVSFFFVKPFLKRLA